MRRLRAMFQWIDRYVILAGRSCCAGRSSAGVNRSLARRRARDTR